jgi:hypothetical protein
VGLRISLGSWFWFTAEVVMKLRAGEFSEDELESAGPGPCPCCLEETIACDTGGYRCMSCAADMSIDAIMARRAVMLARGVVDPNSEPSD